MFPPRRPVDLAGGRDGEWASRLERWAAEARVDVAAEARSREQWLRRQAEEEGTLAGVLADLADAGVAVRLHLRAGGPFAGRIRAVGADLVAVVGDGAPGSVAVVALDAICSVRTGPAVRPVTGDRAGPSPTMRLADVLVGLAAEREPVRVVTVDGEAVAGVVRAVGQDVVTLRAGAGGGAAATAYVAVAAVAAVVVGE